MTDLVKVHTYYIYSLNAFVTIFLRSIDLVSGERDPMNKPSLIEDEAEGSADFSEGSAQPGEVNAAAPVAAAEGAAPAADAAQGTVGRPVRPRLTAAVHHA